ncbi:hypothetical protein [Pseudanabaena sp. FACHB-2040]|uniref:hypothetical protein n=1 Tax=Pseudanabaena sp. FACHB-2040 TaxID=2692859 RepID=UPI001683F9AB|nr:hypothetical protein [Pseudanabaena sp. FACHB-2040]MBD2259915.1 hypothetical protein [Pseudanabaena sp. FACHB-2040]
MTPDIQSVLWGFLGGLITVAGTVVAITNWLNGRFNQLFISHEKLNGKIETLSNREASNNDHLGYLYNANKELIEHRTRRFQEEIKRLQDETVKDIEDIKSFLDKTTEFTIRGKDRH